MAKKSVATGHSAGEQSVFELIKSFDDSAEVLSDSKMAVITDYISTGNYMLNACITGSLFKGAPVGRALVLSGDPGCGKSFLAVSLCREAQKKGYTPVYLDSEGAIDIEFIKRLGCDVSNFIIRQVTTISEVSTFLSNFLAKVNSFPEGEKPKIVIVLDSLSNLTSDKEMKDILEATGKKDMTKAQDIKALFRTNATAIAKAKALFVVCSHVYSTQVLFAKKVVSGGCLVGGEKIRTSNGVKNIEDVVEGDIVVSHDATLRKVLKTFKFKKSVVSLSFEVVTETGVAKTITCSFDHKFLTDEDGVWTRAIDLDINDCIYSYDVDGRIVPAILKEKKVYSKERDVYDICVEDVHTYVSENGIINHNSGINYNSSVTIMLSAAKLEDKTSDKIVSGKVGDFTKTGVLVTATPKKSRFTIPQKVQFQIPFFKSPNPYIGIEKYLTWENSGIIRGELLYEKDYDKLSSQEKDKCYEMVDCDGVICYAKPKDTARTIVVKHLGKKIPVTDFYTPEVFTDELLHKLDEEVIKPNFELPSSDSMMDVEEFLEDGFNGDE